MAEEKGTTIARAYVLIVPSLQGSQKTLSDELVPATEEAAKEAGEKGGGQLSAALGKAAKVAAAAIAAAMAGAVALVKSSLDSYAETEQLSGGIEKLFGVEAAQTVFENASDAYKTAGMDANTYMKSVTGLAAALLKSGISSEEAAVKADEAMRQIADNANTFGRLSADQLAEVYGALARGSYQVLDQLSLGYGGTKKGMEDLIKDANAYAKATGRASNLTIDSYADIVTAIGLIQEKSGIAGTTVKEAEQTISGSLSMLSGAWSNFIAGLGDPNADLDRLIDNVIKSLDSAAGNIIPTVDRIAKALIKALPDMVRRVADWIPTVLPTVLEAISALAVSVANVLPDILETLVQVLTDNADMLINAAISIALALVAALPRIIDALTPAIPKVVTALVDGFVDHIPDFIGAAIDIVAALVEAIPDIIVALLDALPATVDRLVKAFTDPANIQKMLDAGKRLGNALVQGLISTISNSSALSGATLGFDSTVIAGGLGVNPNLLGNVTSNTKSETTNIGTVTVVTNSSNLTSIMKQAKVMAGA